MSGLRLLLSLAVGCAGRGGTTADSGAEPVLPAETLGNHEDDDEDGLVDELPAPDALGSARIVSANDGAVLTLEGQYLPVIREATGGQPWYEAEPVGFRTDPHACCGHDLQFWVPDLDGDALPELLVNGDDRYWLEGMWFSRTVVYPGSVATGGGFSLADARWATESTVTRILDPWSAEPRWVYAGREGTLVAPASALHDGVLQRSDAEAEVAGAPGYLQPGSSDLDGDGLDELVLVVWEGSTSSTPPIVEPHAGTELGSLTLADNQPLARLRLPDDSRGIGDSAVADVNGDGVADLITGWSSHDGYGASFGAWVGPLVGEPALHVQVEVPHTRLERDGSVLALGDVEGDGREDVGVGVRTDEETGFAILLGATLAEGGNVDLTSVRYAARFASASSPLYYAGFAGQLDDQPGMDLALYLRDPVGPAGTEVAAGSYGSELHFGLGD